MQYRRLSSKPVRLQVRRIGRRRVRRHVVNGEALARRRCFAPPQDVAEIDCLGWFALPRGIVRRLSGRVRSGRLPPKRQWVLPRRAASDRRPRADGEHLGLRGRAKRCSMLRCRTARNPRRKHQFADRPAHSGPQRDRRPVPPASSGRACRWKASSRRQRRSPPKSRSDCFRHNGKVGRGVPHCGAGQHETLRVGTFVPSLLPLAKIIGRLTDSSPGWVGHYT